MLNLYPATLQNFFFQSVPVVFCVESLELPIYSIMSSAYKNFTTSLPMWTPFSFSCLTAIARTSNIMLNRSGESGHPYPAPELVGRLPAFHH